MLATETQAFLKTLEVSNLLSEEQLRKLIRRIDRSTGDVTPIRIAQTLLRGRLVTRWQAEMLLGGQSGFFFGRYKLLDQLGEGGMGSVFKAEQTGFHRIVALKLMADGLLKDQTAVARFHREIQSAAALNHPHIVTAYDADAAGDTHFLVMEHVDGVDLGTIGKEQPGELPIGWVCECIRQAAEGLGYAHQQGMIHRDVKPANLLVTHREGTNEPWVKVLDMGLARFVSEAADETALTSTGQVMGTPDYVSPEQAQNARTADARSDVFSLGCTLFRLLTGQLPYAGDNMMEKLSARFTGTALRMRPFRSVIPRDLEALVAKMLERDPNRRYQTAGEVASALVPFAALSPDDPVAKPANRALGQLTVKQRIRSGGDTQFNLFLDRLATEAAEDHDSTETITLGSRSDSGTTPAAQTRGATKMQEWIEDRRAIDMRRWMWTLTGLVAFVFLLAGYLFWDYSGRAMLVLDLDDAAREEVTLRIDRTTFDLSGNSRLEFPGRWGPRSITLKRDGYKVIQEQIDLARGETRVYKPKWVLLPETARKQQWAALQQEVLGAAKNFGNPLPLRSDLLVRQLVTKLEDFQLRWTNSDEAAAARDLLDRLPLPIDLLQRRKIPRHELEAAGNGDPQKAPAELVAVLGDSRFMHGAPIQSMAISPDGNLLATTGGDYFRLWDFKTGRATWAEHGGGQRFLQFMPDGKSCVGSHGITLRAWRFDGGRRRTDIPQSEQIRALDLTADGRLLAVATATGVEIREGVNGEVMHKLATERRCSSLAFSPDGSQLAYGGEYSLLGLIDTANGAELRRFSGVSSNTSALDWHPDGDLLLSGHYSGQVFLWNPADGTILESVRRPSAVSDVSFVGAGESFIVRDRSAISVWDGAAAEVQREFAGGPFALSADGSTLAVARGGTVELRNPATGELLQPTRPHGPLTTANKLAVSPDGSLLASGHVDGTVSLWDLSTGSELDLLDGGSPDVRALAFSPQGTHLAVGGQDGLLTLWSLATRRPIWRTNADSSWVHAVAFSHDGASLASLGQDPNVELRDVATGMLRHVLYGGDHNNRGVAFSPDGRQVAAAGDGQTVHVWQIDGGELVHATPVPGRVSTIAFHPDGSTLAVGMTSGKMYLLETLDWRGLRRLQENGGNVRGLSFSADGTVLAGVEHNGAVRVWDPATQKGPPLKTIQLDPYDIRATDVAVTPEGRHLIVATEDSILVYRRKPALAALPADPEAPLTNPRYVEPSADQIFATHRRTGNDEALLPLLDRRIATTGKVYDYLYRADARAALGQYDLARSDYDVAAFKLGDAAPGLHWREVGWWVIGPYPPDLQTQYPPEQNPDPRTPARTLDAAGNVQDETRDWQPVTAADGYINFDALLGTGNNVSAYALLRVYSDGERPVALPLFYDDTVRLWLNGELVYENNAGWSVAHSITLPVTLQAGWNTFLAKVGNVGGPHRLRMQFSEEPAEMVQAFAARREWSAAARWLRDELRQAPFDERLQRHALVVAWKLAARTTDDPADAKLALELAELAAPGDSQESTADAWQMLIPGEISSSGGSTMVPQPDGSIFVTGALPAADVYTLRFPLDMQDVTGIALEPLPDERLPFGSSGRFPNPGSFVINHLTMALADGNRSSALKIRRAVADYWNQNSSIEAAFDDDAASYWSVHPRQSEPHVAIFELTKPVTATTAQELSIQIHSTHSLYPNRGLGRFRIWAATAENPLSIKNFPIGRPCHPASVLALAELRTGNAAAALNTLGQLTPDSSRASGNAALVSALAHSQGKNAAEVHRSFQQLECWFAAESLPESFQWLLLETVGDALAADPANAELYARGAARLAQSLDRAGLSVDAEEDETKNRLAALQETIDTRLARDSRNVGLLELRGELAGLRSDFASQIADFTAAIDLLAAQSTPQAVADLERLHRRRGEAHFELENWQQAAADYGQIVTEETTDEKLLADYALAIVGAARPDWTVPEPVEMSSAGGATLERQPDGSILVTGPNPDEDLYTILLPLASANAGTLRLETFADERLPHAGSGRSPVNGNFHLGEFSLSVRSAEEPAAETSLSLTRAVADVAGTQGRVIQNVLDGERETLFSPYPQQREDHFAIFEFRIPPEAAQGDLQLVVRLDTGTSPFPQHGLGRFRLSVADASAAADAFEREQDFRTAMKATESSARLGVAFALTGRPEKAAEAFANAIEHAADAETKVSIAEQAAAYDESFAALAGLRPDDPLLQIGYGRMLATGGRWDDAAAAFQAAAELDAEAIPNWIQTGFWMVGPYPADIEQAYPPEVNPNPLQPVASSAGIDRGRLLQWQPVSPGAEGRIELGTDLGCNYALTYVWSSDEQQVAFQMGDDNALRLFVNDRLLFESEPNGGVSLPKEYEIAVTLRAGWNSVLFKVYNRVANGSIILTLSSDPRDLDVARRGLREYEARRHLTTASAEQAVALLTELIDENPADGELYGKRARSYEQLQQWELAAADYSKQFDLLPATAPRDRIFSSPRSKLARELIRRGGPLFDKLLELRPGDTHLRTCLGREFVLKSDWDTAVKHYAAVGRSAPASEESYEYAALLLLTEEERGYRDFVDRLVARHGNTDDVFLGYALARSAAISDRSQIAPGRIVDLAEQAVAEQKSAWFLHVSGLALYRADRFDEARVRLEESLQASWRPALNQLVLSLIDHELGKSESARELLQTAREEIATVEQNKQNGYVTIAVTDWLEMQVLLREAESQLGNERNDRGR